MNKNILMAAIAASLFSSTAFATNGMFAHGYGTKNKSLAGAGVAATNQGAMSSANNPASMAFVGNEWEAGAELFAPRRSYENTAGAGFPNGGAGVKVESDNDWFIIPSFGYSMDLGGGNNLGVAIYGNGGQNADYTTDEVGNLAGALGGGTLTSDILQLFTNISFASKLSDTSSWGASLIVAVQSLEIKGLGQFAGLTQTVQQGGVANDLTNNGADWAIGGGIKLGYITALTNTLTLGISGQSKMYMTEHDDYTDILTSSDSLDIPATATIGLTWAVTPKSKFLLDYQYIWYANIETLGDDDKSFTQANCLANNDVCVGGPDGPGFGWNNMGIVKVGWEWEANPEWTWRVGYSHGNQPISRTQTLFNVLAPATIENHVTFGFTKVTGKDSEVNFAAMYAPKASVTGIGGTGFQAAPTTLEMHQYSLEASWNSRF
ncbi:MAG: hypothetical protein HOM11_14945 [Methylococcales bacterium]|jgi:long-chain fatty acid transport protein|nr:hypothetical protein [Methylococcales bacterium]MBT7443831.1 hypothetical protein [Methylococcales bacterium]